MPSSKLAQTIATFSKHGLCAAATTVILTAILIATLGVAPAYGANNAVPFVDIVSPVSVRPGSTSATLTVEGTGFVSASTVDWNGTALTTTFVSSRKLTAAVPDSFVAAVGLGSVTVVSPSPGGGTSNVTYLPVAATEASTSFPSTPTSSVTVGSGPGGIATADFNRDGKLDFAVANGGSNNVSILLGNGDGTFTTKSTPAAGSAANWLAVGDFNGDGKLDLAVANSGSSGTGGVSILLGNGDGTFTLKSSPNTGNSPFAITTGDFNGDGKLDLAVSNQSGGTVTILLGNGDGTFSAGGTLTVGNTPQVIDAGDFNEDGKLDLAVSNEGDSTVSVLLGNGDGTFQSQATFATGGSGSPIGLIAADYNGDGHLDLAAVDATDVAILLGNGNGSFTLKANPGAGENLIAGVAGDYNGDGKLDIVVSDSDLGEAFLFAGKGDGTFQSPVTFTTASGAYDVATADFNGDGGLDLAVTNQGANNVSIFLQLLPVGLRPTSLSFGNQLVNTSSSFQSTVLTNSTGSTLNFTSIGFTGTNNGDFSQTNTCGSSIAVGGNCTIDVTFTPSGTGSRSATLTVVDNASNSPQTLAVTGIGTEASAITSANSTAFTVGSAQSFTVTTSGYPAPSLSETGSLPSGVTFTDNGNGTATLAGTPAGSSAGTYTFTITASNGIGSNATQTFTLTVDSPPAMTTLFGASTIPLNGTTSLTFSISNSNSSLTLNGVSFTDSLPTGLVVATPNSLSNTCSGTTTASAGSSSVSLSGSTLAPNGSCMVSVNVAGITSGVKNNSTTIASTNGGSGNASNASITVVSAPTINSAFGASSIPLNSSTSLSFTIQNNNTTQSLGGIAFTDTLPIGLVVSTPNGLVGPCGGGTITAMPGANAISLSGATIAASASCTFSVSVTGTLAGTQNNVTSGVTSTQGGTGNTASATLNVEAPPSIAKSFNPTSIALNATTSLTFTITNSSSNVNALTGVGFTDTLPTGLTVANASATVCGGTLTTTAPTGIAFSGATVAANGQCQFSVTVTGATSGQYTNTTGAVSSTNGGTGNTATASLTVINPPSITQSFAPTSVVFGATSTLTLTVSNSNASSTLNGVAFTDTFPSGLVVATPSNLSSTCSGTATGSGGSTSVSLSGATLSPGASCTVTASVQASVSTFSNSVNATSTDAGGLTGSISTASLTVTKANTTSTVTSSANPSVFGQVVTFTATVSPVAPGAGTPTGTVTFLNGGSPVGSGTIIGGVATFATSVLAVGNHTITTNYGGDGNFNGSTGSLTGNPQVVTKANTATVVTSSVNPSVFGQSVTFTATVSAVAPGSGTPTGTVTFLDSGSPVGSGTIIGGIATFTTSALTVGNHTITTNYGGDGNFNGSTGSLIGNPQVVNKSDGTTTVTSSQDPQTAGQPVTFTATVSAVAPGAGTPTGTVAFLDGGSPIGTGTLSGGIATFTTSILSPGSHTITTSYGGDGNFNGSTGSLIGNPQVIAQASTSTTVTASQGTITLGDTVTFTATVTPASGTPTGLITFFDGYTPLGSSALQLVSGNSQATFSTSLLSAAGSPHSITATYQGATSFAASTSSAISEAVNERTSSAGAVVNPTGVVVGQSSTATVTLTDSGSVPPGTADTFSPTGTPATGRTGFTSTLFADGLVLVVGGTDANNNVLNSAEIYSVSGAAFSTTGNLNTARTGALAVLLPTGKVLIGGGSSDGTPNGALNTAELFDPSAGTFTVAGSGSTNIMTAARFGATAALLNNGQVLIAGGANSGGVLNSAELYNPTTDTFTSTGNLNTARTGASAILLETGKVLLAGGSSDGTANGALNSAELFNPAGNSGAGAFTSVAGSSPTLETGRWQPEAALLPSGKVLVAGGQNSGGALSSADLYDPLEDSFTASNQNMSQARANGWAVSLPSGMVLLAGGTTSQAVDLYNADSNQFDTTGSLQQSDDGLVSTLLNNGDVLVVGLTTAATPASDAGLYSPSFNPLGTVGVSSSEGTDSFGAACVLSPSTSTASTCTTTVTPANVATSPHTITGTYPADAVHFGSNSTASLTVTTDNSTITITSNAPNPSAVNQSVSVSASVTANSPGSGTPTGTATVNDGAGQACVIVLTSGAGSCSLTPVIGGTDTLTATYSGDANFNGSTSIGVSQTVEVPPSINQAFSPTSIPLNGTTSLTFIITNPSANTAAETGVEFSDTLPTGLVVATPNGLTNSCGGAPSALAGGTSISLTGGSIAVNSTCTVVVNVTGTMGGAFTNTSGAVSSTNGGTGSTATANLTVVVPTSINEAFSPNSIPLNGISTLTLTVTNPAANTAAELGVALSDNLPAGLMVATPSGLTDSCGGVASAMTGGTSISLTGGGIAVNSSCTLVVNVTGTTAGTFANASGAVSSTDGGTGNTATANLTVVAPPSIANAFSPTTIALNGTSALTFTITNPAANTVAEGGVAFTDTLPTGLVVATPNGLTNTCGGSASATAGGTSVNLTGGSIAVNTSCALVVNVTGATSGQFTNASGAVSSTNGGTGNTSPATLTVATSPSINVAFGASSIALAASTSASFTISNPNAGLALTSVGFADTLPSGLVISTPNGLAGSCGSGTISASAGSQSISLTNGTIAVSSSCSFSVNVTAVAAGNQVDTTSNLSSGNAGTGNAATASLNVLAPDLTIAGAHSGNFYQGQSAAVYTVTVTNTGLGPTAGTVTVTEAPPSGLTVIGMSGAGWTCNTGTLSCTRTDALATGASYPSITVTVNVAANEVSNVTNSVSVSGGGELNTANDTATDPTMVTLPPDFSLSLSATAIQITSGGTATYMITVTPQNNVFPNSIALTASGLPPNVSVTFSPSTLTPGANAATSTLTIASTGGDPFVAGNITKHGGIFGAMLLPLFGVVLSGFGFRERSTGTPKMRWLMIAVLAGCSGFALSSCAPQSNFQKLGTASGTYTLTITATSGAIQHSMPAMLVVQP